MVRMWHVVRVGVAVVVLVGAGVATAAGAGASSSSWSIVHSPNTSSAQDNVLNGVSCSGTAFCVAVGFHGPPQVNPIPPHTLIESWNGSVWSIVPSPNVPPTLRNPFNQNILSAVSCSRPTACMAVGQFFTGQRDRSLIELWNGSVWSIVPSPTVVGSTEDQLLGVSCTGPAACVAVGATGTNQGGNTLIESWNGLVWSIVPSPNVASKETQLNGVSCDSPVACFAVGLSFPSGTFIAQTLIESWNGSTWSIVPSPNRSANDVLAGVSCSGPSACMSIGGYSTTGVGQTLIESWNGSTWSIVPSPNTSPTHANDLSGVSCSNSVTCTAVGGYNAGNPNFGPTQTLIESWNGSTWSIVSSPNPSPFSLLNGVACTGPTTCTAAGFYSISNDKTLIEASTATSSHSPTIFAVTLKSCTNLHVGYNYFPAGTIVHWHVNQTGTGTLASGSFTTLGGGRTYHFLTMPLGVTLKPDSASSHTHVRLSWTIKGAITNYEVTRDPGC
jgi:hypothetical protein